MDYSINVNLKKEVDYSYPIFIGSKNADEALQRFENDFFLIDKNVYELYPRLFEKLNNVYVFEAHENSKDFESVMKIIDWLAAKRANRKSNLIVVGGGITGDVGGFAASIYMRGINFIQIPTTLLSMVDSSVGGKTGINFAKKKNFVGSFKQPKEVIIDVNFLKSLPYVEFQNGLAEVLKYALMFSEGFYDFLMENAEKIRNLDLETVLKTVFECVRFKAKVVEKDELESGVRKFLNFGHTVGHAIEADSDYEIKHGFAVAIGMYYETLLGVEIGEVEESTVQKVEEILNAFGFDFKYRIKDEKVFFDALAGDKKNDDSGVVLSLTNGIGAGKIITGLSMNSFKEFFIKNGVLNG